MKKFIRIATLGLASLSLALFALAGCGSTTAAEGSSNSTSSQTPSSEEVEDSGNASLYSNYALDGDISVRILRSANQMVTFVEDTNATAISFVAIFTDAYGDYLGDYKYEWDDSIPGAPVVENIRGLDEVNGAEVYIYSYLLEDGTYWGDHKAYDNGDYEDILNYGVTVPVEVMA